MAGPGVCDMIECAELLLRGAKPRWIGLDPSTGWVIAQTGMFLPRRELFEEGLSVNRACMRGPAESLAGWHVGICAVWSVHAGWTRDLGLSLTASPTRANPSHATICGIPYADDDEVRALYLANKLRVMARFERFRDAVAEGRARRRSLGQ